MDNVTIPAVIGAILSMVFEFVPGAQTWWASLTEAQRGYLNGAFVAVASVIILLYQCYVSDSGTCPGDWVQAFINILLPLFLGNQLAYNAVGKPLGKRS